MDLKAFAQLYRKLQEASGSPGKAAAAAKYFASANPGDAAWTLKLLLDGKTSRVVAPKTMRAAAIQAAEVGEWLYDECKRAVRDAAETQALIVPSASGQYADSGPFADWMDVRIPRLQSEPPNTQIEALMEAWDVLSTEERLAFNKIVSGTLRPKVDQETIAKALAIAFDLPESAIHHRLSSGFKPTADCFLTLTKAGASDAQHSLPFPFQDASEIAEPINGDLSDWIVEWKWDGVRAQLVRRDGGLFVWTRSGLLVTDRFPEIAEAAQSLPNGTVLDGEILLWHEDRCGPRTTVQRRIDGSEKINSDSRAVFMAIDVLQSDGHDIRTEPLRRRRNILSELVPEPSNSDSFPTPLFVNAVLEALDWEAVLDLAVQARRKGVEGLVLKQRNSPYGPTNSDSSWLVVRPEHLSVNAVLMYAERDNEGGYANYSFGAWSEDALVPIAKIQCDLCQDELLEINAFIRENTLERIGPVRTVPPVIVMEIGFDGVESAPRRKAGIVLRSPRVIRWQREISPERGVQLQEVKGLTAG